MYRNGFETGSMCSSGRRQTAFDTSNRHIPCACMPGNQWSMHTACHASANEHKIELSLTHERWRTILLPRLQQTTKLGSVLSNCGLYIYAVNFGSIARMHGTSSVIARQLTPFSNVTETRRSRAYDPPMFSPPSLPRLTHCGRPIALLRKHVQYTHLSSRQRAQPHGADATQRTQDKRSPVAAICLEH